MESARKVAVQSGWVNGSSFPTRTVGADRIRPQHKAPLRGACAGSICSSTPTKSVQAKGLHHLASPGGKLSDGTSEPAD